MRSGREKKQWRNQSINQASGWSVQAGIDPIHHTCTNCSVRELLYFRSS
jgi:hypothetical protein